MKIRLLITVICLAGFFAGCKKSSNNSFTNSMSANVGSSYFVASSISVQLIPNATLPGKTQLTVTGYSGNKILIVIIPDFNSANAAGSYSITSANSAGSYNEGSEDIFLNGTVTINSVSNGIVSGDFDVNTRTYVHISNGSFSAKF